MTDYKNLDDKSFGTMWAREEKPADKQRRTGMAGLSDRELIKLALNKPFDLFTDSMADDVLKVYEKTSTNSNAFTEELTKIEGIDEATALSLNAMMEFARRRQTKAGRTITTPNDIFQEIRHYYNDEVEKLIVIALNGAHEVISSKVVSMGLINKTIVHPREVFADALKNRAVSIVIAHNHPSKNTEPSEDDKLVTSRITQAGDILGIRVLDHLVFSDSHFYSFLEHGLI